MEINIPEVVAEITELLEAYNQALISNDIATLNSMFWESPLVLRYGPSENLYGIEALRAYRAARPTNDLARDLTHTVITTFGRDFATANTEYKLHNSGRAGRQSQTWCRLPVGWRVVAAHVSFPLAAK